MPKPFLTYDQQANKLVSDKGLIVKDIEFAKEKLREIGYFSLIGGYKKPFRDPMTRVYIGNTTFEDVLAMYLFDRQLRQTVFQYICRLEKKVSNSLSYAFCEHHGELQGKYLDVNN